MPRKVKTQNSERLLTTKANALTICKVEGLWRKPMHLQKVNLLLQQRNILPISHLLCLLSSTITSCQFFNLVGYLPRPELIYGYSSSDLHKVPLNKTWCQSVVTHAANVWEAMEHVSMLSADKLGMLVMEKIYCIRNACIHPIGNRGWREHYVNGQMSSAHPLDYCFLNCLNCFSKDCITSYCACWATVDLSHL